MGDRYGDDVLSRDPHAARRPRSKPTPVRVGMVVEDVETGYVGAVVRIEYKRMDLEDRHGRRRGFPLGPGYLIDGAPVILVEERGSIAGGGPDATRQAQRTASGSVAVPGLRARTARAGRIYVEGRHDAELIERVWGDDLRVEGVVVEYLAGLDHLPAVVAEFEPGPNRRLGVLADHLVAGSKETRIADEVRRGRFGTHTLVVGHPFVDVWQAVKPARLGLPSWPKVPRGQDWKRGTCRALGWAHADRADIGRAWRRILDSVRDWGDLEPELIGRVEELIDFVTAVPD